MVVSFTDYWGRQIVARSTCWQSGKVSCVESASGAVAELHWNALRAVDGTRSGCCLSCVMEVEMGQAY